jgi:hypothetical protein
VYLRLDDYFLQIFLGFINTSFHPDSDESGLLNGTNRSISMPAHPFHPIRWRQNNTVILKSTSK